MPKSRTAVFALFTLIATCAALAGCGGSDSGSKLALVAYSTPKEAYAKLIPGFQATPAGEGIDFSQSYGASGEQSRAVENGLPADVVAFSHEGDVKRLVEAELVAADWNTGPTKGIVTNSVVVFAVREGNPKNIKTWDDLTKPGVDVITANPIVSGGARWNLLAAYGQAREEGKSDEEAIDYIESLLKNVSVQDKSAREALQTFTSGKGDVLITYENEAIAAKNAGEEVEYVIPPTTLLIENPIAVTTKSKSPDDAQAFVDYLLSDAGQKIFAENGYRPVNEELLDESVYPVPSGLFTIAEYGGWNDASKRFFDEKKGVVTKINEELGVDGQ